MRVIDRQANVWSTALLQMMLCLASLLTLMTERMASLAFRSCLTKMKGFRVEYFISNGHGV